MGLLNFRHMRVWVPILIGVGLAATGCSLSGRGFATPGAEQKYPSNGGQVYSTGTSQRGDTITYTMSGGSMMAPANLACGSCHGADGKGGQVQMMMGTFTTPDIRYNTLTSSQGMDHPPYTDETIKQAITQGLDPAGKPLNWPMPRWSMSEQDLNDLIGYLKTLK